MPSQTSSTRQRLIDAALELFTRQGVTDTTTRQIAELAQVNEVTLFRHFGNKHGLLLAVIENSTIFSELGETLLQQANEISSVYQALKDYARGRLIAIEQVPEFIRSVVGEAGQYPTANRQALGRSLTLANRHVAEYLSTVIQRGQLHTHFPPEKLASLLNGMLLGYMVIEFTSEYHELWDSREDFLENLVDLFLHGAVSALPPQDLVVSEIEVVDLPASLVSTILQRAKKQGKLDYAIAYVLFSSGISLPELLSLERCHYIQDPHHHWLRIPAPHARQVSLNQWILGKRYGSHTNNPLTQWLKSRKDEQTPLFLNWVGHSLTQAELAVWWEELTQGLQTPLGTPITLGQVRQTWLVQMLVKGLDLEHLSILSGLDMQQLQPYVRRAREVVALEQAIQLDQG